MDIMNKRQSRKMGLYLLAAQVVMVVIVVCVSLFLQAAVKNTWDKSEALKTKINISQDADLAAEELSRLYAMRETVESLSYLPAAVNGSWLTEINEAIPENVELSSIVIEAGSATVDCRVSNLASVEEHRRQFNSAELGEIRLENGQYHYVLYVGADK